MLGWLIQDAMRLHRKNERFAKITHLATGYTSKYQHQKFPTLTSVNSMDRKDYHAPSAIFEKKTISSEFSLRVWTMPDMKIQLVSKNQGTSNCRISFFFFSRIRRRAAYHCIKREGERPKKPYKTPHTLRHTLSLQAHPCNQIKTILTPTPLMDYG